MKIRTFSFPKGQFNSWELNIIGSVYSLRIARNQFAFWKNYEPVFNFTFGKFTAI